MLTTTKAQRGWRKRVVIALGAGALVTVALLGTGHRAIASRVVTWLALHDATAAFPSFGDDDAPFNRLVENYGPWFRDGFLDRAYLVQKMPEEGVSREAAPVWAVVSAYYKVKWENLEAGTDRSEVAMEELKLWAGPLLTSAKLKEVLVNILTSDYVLLDDPKDKAGGLAKAYLISFVCPRLPKESPLYTGFIKRLKEPWDTRWLDTVALSHWDAIARACDHPREKVRAGSILLLSNHPTNSVFFEKARTALHDPSEWVRLAAAGTLALKGDPRGAPCLVRGLCHQRWEVRWWSGFGLTALENPVHALPIGLRKLVEGDSWVNDQLRGMARFLWRGGFLVERLKASFGLQAQKEGEP